jgi:hypothetical protein
MPFFRATEIPYPTRGTFQGAYRANRAIHHGAGAMSVPRFFRFETALYESSFLFYVHSASMKPMRAEGSRTPRGPIIEMKHKERILKVIPWKKERVSTGPILQQTPFWGKLKECQGCEVRAFRFSLPADRCRTACHTTSDGRSVVADDILVILQPVSAEWRMAYIPYGPTLEPREECQGPVLEELSEWLRPHLPSDCLFIRYDLPWQSPWAEDPDCFNDRGEWQGPPRFEIQEIRMNFDTRRNNLFKAPTNNLPTNTVFIELKGDEDQILKRMKPKTRYNIRLSRRKGVRVSDVDASRLDAWYRLYRETAKRNRIFLHDRRYFETLLAVRDAHPDDRTSIHLLMAEANGAPLAAMFLSISETRAAYLYGASSSRQRNKMATYALQWQAIRRAKKFGCRDYDMFGVSPSPSPSHPMFGLYRFKTGFGGFLYHRQGCWDYPLEADLYRIYQAHALHEEGYHLKSGSG